MSQNDVTKQALSKVPAVTLGFWVIKILATTLGETGGDTVTMTLNWGYLAGVTLFGGVLVALVVAQISAKRFYWILYWATIVASTTFGTTLADFADRSLGIGYAGGSLLPGVLSVGHARAVALVGGNGVGKRRLDAESRGVLLDHDHVFPDSGHRARRLARRHSRIWLRTRRAGIHRGSRSGRSTVLLDRCLACHLVLGRVHPDAASGRNRGGLH